MDILHKHIGEMGTVPDSTTFFCPDCNHVYNPTSQEGTLIADTRPVGVNRSSSKLRYILTCAQCGQTQEANILE